VAWIGNLYNLGKLVLDGGANGKTGTVIMRALLLLALLAAGGYFGYQHFFNQAPPPEATQLRWPQEQIIVCPTCRGEARLTYRDVRGRNYTHSCRVCGFTGRNRIVLRSPASAICPDCKGMGRTEVPEGRRDIRGRLIISQDGTQSIQGNSGYIISAARCQRCAASGVITPPNPNR
jgi:hypothetical protein